MRPDAPAAGALPVINALGGNDPDPAPAPDRNALPISVSSGEATGDGLAEAAPALTARQIAHAAPATSNLRDRPPAVNLAYRLMSQEIPKLPRLPADSPSVSRNFTLQPAR